MRNWISFFAAPPPILSLGLGIELSRAGDHKASEGILKKIQSVDPAYLFYRMINAHQLNNKEEGIRFAEMLLRRQGEIPVRYRDLAIILKAEMTTWTKD